MDTHGDHLFILELEKRGLFLPRQIQSGDISLAVGGETVALGGIVGKPVQDHRQIEPLG